MRSIENTALSGHATTLYDGTVAEALAQPFLIVIGTGGGSADSQKDEVGAFLSRWKREFFVMPRTLRDVDVKEEDIQQYNLVLIGRPANESPLASVNLLASRVRSEVLPSSETQLTGLGEEVYVLPNPLNARRSVVVLNVSTDILNSQSFDPAFTGFYDYCLWDETGVLLESGMFSQGEFDKLSSDQSNAARPAFVQTP